MLWSGIPADDLLPVNPNVPLIAYRKLIRAGLVGGGAAIVRGEQVAVDPAAAEALVAQLDRQPIAETWRIARPLLEASTMGRDATPAELAAFTIGGPDTIIVPDWAWGDAA